MQRSRGVVSTVTLLICIWLGLTGSHPAYAGGLTLDPFWTTYDSKEALANGTAPLLEQNDHYRPFTQEEIQFIKKLHQIVSVFERNPVLNNVDRLTAYIHKPRIKSVDSKGKSLQRLSASFRISICHLDEKNCRYGSLAGHITINVNDAAMKRVFNGPGDFSDQEGPVYLEPEDFREAWLKDGVYPFLTSGDFVFTRNNKPESLWRRDVPYSRAYQHYLSLMKKDFEQCNRSVEKDARKKPASAEDVFSQLKGIMSDEEIAKQRAQFEAMQAKMQPEVNSALKKAPSVCNQLESKYLHLKNEYDAMSSGEQQASAKLLRPDSPKLKALKPEQIMLVHFAEAGDPDVLYMVTPDWNYFDSAAPRTDVQLITVQPIWRKGFHNAAIHEVVAAQDWDAVYRSVK